MNLGLGLGPGFQHGAAALWTPANLTGTLLWVAPDSIVSSGGNVTAWTDKSELGNNLAASGTVTKATGAAPNSLDAVAFGGGELASAAALSTQALDSKRSLLLVYKVTSLGSTLSFLANDATSAGLGFATNATGAKRDVYLPLVVEESDTTSMITAGVWEYCIVISHGNGGATGNQELYVSGAAHTLNASNGMPGAGTGAFQLGNYASAFPFAGDIAECVYAARDWSTDEITKLQTYIHIKYGL